jgi:hypothetical protein
MHDFLSGCSICGFSSAATMVSRVLQEQLLMAVQANPEAHIPPFQAAIIDGGGTYLCYNNPKNTIGQEGGPVCASNGHAGTDCDAARFPSAESLPDITDQAFKAQCLAFGANSIDTQGHGKTTAAGCGAFGLKDVGCCPALVAEDAWASQLGKVSCEGARTADVPGIVVVSMVGVFLCLDATLQRGTNCALAVPGLGARSVVELRR